MKKLLLTALLALAAIGVLAACADPSGPAGSSGDNTVLIVGATPRPHAEILEYIRPYLLEEGIELVIREFTDFQVLNPALADGTLDVNYFQHRPFLEAQPTADQIHVLGYIHIEPMGAYSLTLGSIDELFEGATVALPNDPTNHGRALLLLQTHGLLELDPAAGIRATYTSDILSNPLNLQFQSLDAAILPRILPDVDVAIINTNHVLAGTSLNPVRDSLIIETPDSPFANIVAVRNEDAQNPAILTLLEFLQSESVRAFIYREYDNAVLPVF